jgi:hypothetical protein
MHTNVVSFLRTVYSFCIEAFLRFTELPARKRLSLHLSKKLAGKKVLLVGSGPSANILKNMTIPSEYSILSVNLAPNNLPSDAPLSAYITQSFARAESNGGVDTILKTRSIETLLTNTNRIHSCTERQDAVHIVFNPRDTYYSRPMPLTIAERYHLAQQGQHVFPSSGIQLLQYALSFGASEIYLIGIDVQETVEYTEESSYPDQDIHAPKINKHYHIDKRILQHNAKKYKTIYSATSSSAISTLFPVKSLS